MQVLRALLLAVFAAIALVAGLFAALLVAGTTAAIALGFKLTPRGRRSAREQETARRREAARRAAAEGAIDVAATEVRAEPLLRQ